MAELTTNETTTTAAPTAAPQPTISDVFEIPKPGEPDMKSDRWEAVQKRIKEEVKDVKFPAALSDLGPKICELFNVPLPNILVASWKKVDDLRARLEKSRSAPD